MITILSFFSGSIQRIAFQALVRSVRMGLIGTIAALVACAPAQKLDPQERYLRALNFRAEGDARAFYDELLALAHDTPDSRQGRRARVMLQGVDLLTMVSAAAVVGLLLGREHKERLDASSDRPAIAKGPSDGFESIANPIGDRIRQTGTFSYEIDKEYLDAVLSDLNSIADQARIVPYFVNGQPQGFKLFAIKPDSIHARLGFQNGDIVVKICGIEVKNPEQALAVYEMVRDLSSFSIEILRQGKPIVINIEIVSTSKK
jgi:hypothetical protein